MNIADRAIRHISEVARVPSFSSYEERLHPYIHEVFSDISKTRLVDTTGNNIIYRIPGKCDRPIALTAHLDKINHFGETDPGRLKIKRASRYLEGQMDDSVGVGILLAIAELTEHRNLPDLLFFFSEMEESKGLKEQPRLLKNNGKGYESGMGAKRIARSCIKQDIWPELVITVDTTPLFKGETGVALYTQHWEFNNLDPGQELVEKTEAVTEQILAIDPDIRLDNNTNDFLHYGYEFNITKPAESVVSVALEPAIYPYHQQGERVFLQDIERVLEILCNFLDHAGE